MILDGDERQFPVAQAFHRTVIQIKVAGFQSVFQSFQCYSISMVLRCYMDAPAGQVVDGMIAPAVPELQFESLRAERPADKLMSQADTHYGDSAQQRLNVIDNIGKQRGVARPGGQHYSMRFESHDVFRRRFTGNYTDSASKAAEDTGYVITQTHIHDHQVQVGWCRV